MRAAVLETFDRPPVVTEVDDPTPGPGEAIVRTAASGVCRTDVKVVEGIIPTVKPPLVIGHELAGEVAAVGVGVTRVVEGDRVIASLDLTCGQCTYCRIGEADHCRNLRRLGLEQDGSLAEYVRIPAANLIHLPESVPFDEGATIPDAVGSPYHAVVRQAQVRPGQTVAVWGLGGLGLAAVQVAALAGAQVIAIARTPERRELAEKLGASHSLDPSAGDVVAAIHDLTGGLGVHAFIDLVGIEGSTDAAVHASRKGGRVVVVGYVVPQLSVTTMRMVYDEVAVMGSRGSTRGELEEAVALVAQGRIRPVIGEHFRLDDVNAALDQLREGSVIGRAVVTSFS